MLDHLGCGDYPAHWKAHQEEDEEEDVPLDFEKIFMNSRSAGG
jgi:hypothetical protein